MDALSFPESSKQVEDWQLISEITDPENLSLLPELDVTRAAIEQLGLQLRFTIETRGNIPSTYPLQSDSRNFNWLIDADRNPATGLFLGGIGGDFNVFAISTNSEFGGIDPSASGTTFPKPVISGNVVQFTITLDALGSPSQFDWVAFTLGVDNQIAIGGNGASESKLASILPAPLPASRVQLEPPLLLLSPTGTSSGQLSVRLWDENGNELDTSSGHLVEYQIFGLADLMNFDPETGTVTALAPPEEFLETPSVLATVDGVSGNFSLIRITESDLGLQHQYYRGSHVVFYAPPNVEGIDLDGAVRNFQIVEATDIAFRATRHGLTTPPWGETQVYFVLDPGTDHTVPCGRSGNALRLGWTLTPGEGVGPNCFYDLVNNRPSWFIYFHELGHNFAFTRALGDLFFAHGSNGEPWSEGLASFSAQWAFWTIKSCSTTLNLTSRSSIVAENNFYREIWTEWPNGLNEYQANGANYENFNANILNAILFELFDDFGPKVWFDLYSTFLPTNEPLPCTVDNSLKATTFFPAAISASSGLDLRDRFRNDYGFPIDDAAWPELLSCAQQRIDARVFSLEAACAAADPNRIFANGFELVPSTNE